VTKSIRVVASIKCYKELLDFTQVLHNDNCNVVLNELNTLIDNINTNSVTPDQVNGIINDLGNVLLNAASSTFGQNQRRKKGNSVNNKP
jgi:hypothetical protein